jgi:CheY-like chemotaxis protein
MEPKIIDLNQLIIDLNKMLRRLISENIQIELRLAKETNYIIADQGQLEQIFINLVVNARDAINQKFNAPKKKKIIIQTGNVYLDDSFSSNNHKSRKGDHVYFSVADNGIGMDEDTKQKIFDPFFTTKKKGEGTGLGLSTVYGIIEQNNAWITADSIKGIGSTFTIYWPHEKSIDQTILTNDNDLDISKGDETILLVEDDQQVRKMTSDALKILGYHVINFSDGLKALHLINNQNMNVDLLITDIVMPNISGQDLAIKFLNIKPASKLLFISGYNDKLNIQHHILKDKLNFINKPFSFHSLAHKVRNVLDMRH